MLQPSKNRLDYGELLIPPEGFRLEHAIATSYSLDLDTLVSIPVALYFAQTLDLNFKADFMQILDSIRRASSSLKVYCQKGQIKVPENQHRLYSFLEECIAQVKPTMRDSFHPKVWVIRYKSEKNEIKYRVIILSRNLTFDRSWDVAFQMDGDFIKDRAHEVKKTKPLVDFIDYLGTHSKPAWFKTFVRDLAKTEFELTQNEFEDFDFYPTGFGKYKENIVFDSHRYDDLLIVSPFLTNDGLEHAKSASVGVPRLFSRQIELKKINPDLLKSFNCWHLSNDFVDGEMKVDADTEENLLSQLQDLHAKIYSYKDGRDAYLLLGSANCSERAMLRNVEFMINLKGKNSKIGPDAIFKELVNDDLKVFQPFNHEEQLSDAEKLEIKHEQALQRIKISIVNASVKGIAKKQEDNNFLIDLAYDLSSVPNEEGIDLAAYLLRSDNQKHQLTPGSINNWTVFNIAELDLSCFLVVEVRIKGTNIGSRFALKISIENLPETRNSKIFKDIISTPSNFFKYIQFLLAENHLSEDLEFEEKDATTNYEGFGVGAYLFQETPLYENMLRAASRQPEKLKEIKNVIDKINEEEKDNTIIPPDFKRLWEVFEKVQSNEK